MDLATREAGTEFADIICADPHLLRQELDALIAASCARPRMARRRPRDCAAPRPLMAARRAGHRLPPRPAARPRAPAAGTDGSAPLRHDPPHGARPPPPARPRLAGPAPVRQTSESSHSK